MTWPTAHLDHPPLSGAFAARALGGPGVRVGRPCACGAPATTALPYLSEWACLHCTIGYYTTLVQHGAASYRAKNYCFAEPDPMCPFTYERACRRCQTMFGTDRPHGLLCAGCRSHITRGNRSHGRHGPRPKAAA